MRIPVYQNQIEEKKQTSMPQASPTPVREAFGENIYRETANLGSRISDLGNKLADHFIERDKRDNDQYILQQDTNFRKDLQDSLTNPEKDEDGIPKGVLLRQGTQAENALNNFDMNYFAIKQKYLDSAQNDYQRTSIDNLMEKHYLESRDNVSQYQARQENDVFKSVLEANLKDRISSAGGLAYNLKAFDDEIKLVTDSKVGIATKGQKNIGIDSRVIENNNKNIVGEMVTNAVNYSLELTPQHSKVILEKYKDKISPDLYAKLQQTIDGKNLANDEINTFNKFNTGEYKLSNGELNLAVITKTIQADNSIPVDKQNKLINFMESKNNQQKMFKNQQEAAADRLFFNDIVEAKKSNMLLEDALKLTVDQKYSVMGDNYEILQRKKIVEALYKPIDPITNESTYNVLRERINLGEKDMKFAVDEAYNRGLLSHGDYRGLRGDSLNGVTQEIKDAHDEIKALAVGKFGKFDKEETEKFLRKTIEATRGMSPKEMIVYARESFEKVPKTGWFKDDTKYEVAAKQQDIENVKWGILDQTIGANTVRKIGYGVIRTNTDQRKTWNVDDVNRFADAFGGLENIKKGTAVGYVIENMTTPVTVENVKAILNAKPDLYRRFNQQPINQGMK